MKSETRRISQKTRSTATELERGVINTNLKQLGISWDEV